LSFEPLSQVFKLLKENAKDDSGWEVFNYAIGDANEKREINIAGNSLSSLASQHIANSLRICA
jgi:FkbM family methyltransferase